MKLTRLIVVVLLAAVAIGALTGCGVTTVKPGEVGIKVNMYGGNRGVDKDMLCTGRVFYNPVSEDVHKFPITWITKTWCKDTTEDPPVDESITFNSVEGSAINIDVSIRYRILEDEVPNIFTKYRKSADELTRTVLWPQVRDSFNRVGGQMKAVEVYGVKKGLLADNVLKDVNAKLKKDGFEVGMVTINALRVDQNVQNAINRVIEATQKAEEAKQKVAQAEAEKLQRIAKAEGEAKANEILTASLTDKLIKWQELQNQTTAIEKWNGTLPQVTGGGGVPLLQLK